MENKATTKTPIPTSSGFRNFAFCVLIFALPKPLSVCLFMPSCLSGYKSIMQNKANFKMGNINISIAKTKAYANEQRTMNNERYPKQTQTNPIPPPPPAPGKNPESRSETHIPIYRASIKDRESRIENQPSSPSYHGIMALLRKTNPIP